MIKFDTREKHQKEQEIILRHIMIDFIILKYTKMHATFISSIRIHSWYNIHLSVMLHLSYLCFIMSLIEVDIRENAYFLLRLIVHFNDSRDITRYATRDYYYDVNRHLNLTCDECKRSVSCKIAQTKQSSEAYQVGPLHWRWEMWHEVDVNAYTSLLADYIRRHLLH